MAHAGEKRKSNFSDAGIVVGGHAEWEAARRKQRKTSRPDAPAQSPTGIFSSSPADLLEVVEPLPLKVNKYTYSTNDETLSGRSDLTALTPKQSKPVCNCGKIENAAQGVVECANPVCQIGKWHKKCVGLAKRIETAGWRCIGCRLQAQHSGQPQPSLDSVSLATPGQPEPPLHPEQERVVSCIEEGHNVFYTGSAGTGKSTVLKAFVKRLKNMGKQVDIVAPSGIAALNVGGMTIFSYAYWHPDSFKEPMEKLLEKSHGKSVRRRLGSTDVLVIDEISMVERDLLVRLDAVMREVREGWHPEGGRKKSLSKHSRRLPFGGAQVVVTGDFCQLPPVKPFKFCMQCGGDELPGWESQDGRVMKCKRCPLTYAEIDKWAFRSRAWEDCNFTHFELKHIHRQSDKTFINILQKCRLGKPLLPSEGALLTKSKPDPPGAVKLLPRKREVNEENMKNFNRLGGTPRVFECADIFSWRNKNEPELQRKGQPKYQNRPTGPLLALNDHRFEETIKLKVGMLVILVVNLDFPAGLVNGSQGTIVRFEKYDPNKTLVPRRESSPPPGAGSKSAKYSLSANEHADFKEEQVRRFIEQAETQEWPVVQFQNSTGTVTRTIVGHCQLSELGSERPYSLIGRTQIPLLAAWAITVHKSQGMTLDRVIVDLHSSFEREMVYVALSRARNLEGLKVLRLAKNMAQGTNEEVQQFLKAHFDHEAPSKSHARAAQTAKAAVHPKAKSTTAPRLRKTDSRDSLDIWRG